MKRIIALLVLVALSSAAFAQKASYKELRQTYAPGDYVKSDADAYSVFWTGLESFGIPGAGQLMMKENKRGWIFLGSSIVINAIGNGIADDLLQLIDKDANGDWTIPDANKDKVKSKAIALGCVALAELGVSIWSCVDAVKVAKVKNQYYQDLQKKHAFSATLYPSVDLAHTAAGVAPAPGMTLAVRF